jgi:ferredoxin
MMRKICTVSVNGEEFSANCGDLLLDAAMMNGVEIPHDCRSGYCGTCRVNVVSGRAFGGDGGSSDVIHACQARVISDLKVEIEDVPETLTESGRIVDLVRLAPDVAEVAIAMPGPAEYLPGQHYKV